MYLVSVFSLLALSLPVMAASGPIALTCITNPPTTSFGIRTEGDELVATVIHSFGSRFAPAISGIFTPNDLPLLAERAKLVEAMKPITTFRWPKSKCRRTDDLLFQCFGTEDVQEGQNGEKIRPFALYTTHLFTDGIAGKYENLQVTLSFDVDGKSGPRIEMSYPIEQCVPRYLSERLSKLGS